MISDTQAIELEVISSESKVEVSNDHEVETNCAWKIWHFFVDRLLMFLFAIWMWIDMILDANQTWTYYDYSFNPNTCFKNHLANKGEMLDKTYFTASICFWVLSPLLLSFFMIFMGSKDSREGHSTNQTTMLFGGVWFISWFVYSVNLGDYVQKLPLKMAIIVTFFFYPYALIFTFFAIYFAIPLGMMIISVKVLIYGKKNHFWGQFQQEQASGHKTYEILGEALPQFILSVIYVVNNFQFTWDTDKIFESQMLPTSIISSVFSFGSLIIGLGTACCYWKKAGV